MATTENDIYLLCLFNKTWKERITDVQIISIIVIACKDIHVLYQIFNHFGKFTHFCLFIWDLYLLHFLFTVKEDFEPFC